ncbi:hypothetical protein CEXT_731711 [Caerostris extrusa]|uniref:Secreted protein n=1 Tax=Caerostris extrusa TaxID=172846 RepID=A0AAV4R5C3_CAEEX|nr:hypothetical protein CEXT_731711 [Caerostris extrusa]
MFRFWRSLGVLAKTPATLTIGVRSAIMTKDSTLCLEWPINPAQKAPANGQRGVRRLTPPLLWASLLRGGLKSPAKRYCINSRRVIQQAL